ncbi:unnamed protein product [Strongylus vulgaris]|uniref:Immunoglobulin I-set domain-containing protein n=1 Tax=Strongylus vulgaris TaxID=40348 RepID=A0A3P7K8A7_STRVU|nr:unnamed protein product [Strongylus vulgaris]
MWHALVDELVPVLPPFSLLTGQRPQSEVLLVLDKRPQFLSPLTDITVCEGEDVVLRTKVSSASPFTVTWRGPAVHPERAVVETDDGYTLLRIPKIVPLECGPYSVVAENEHGSSSSLAFVKVIARPEAPSAVVCERVGRNALLLSWSPASKSGSLFCVEYRSEG